MFTISKHAFFYSCLLIFASAICAVSQTRAKSEYPPLPPIIMNTPLNVDAHTSFTLAEHHGELLLVYLWGVWCWPCRPQVPNLVELRNKYHEKGFEIIGLNVGDEDGNREQYPLIKDFAANNRIDFPLVQGPREVSLAIYKLANFEAVPMAMLLDREGKLRAIIGGGGPENTKQMQIMVKKIIADDAASPAQK